MMKSPSTAEMKEWAEALTSPSWDSTGFEACPSPETLWLAACGQLDPEEAMRVADHAARCSICAHDLRAAQQSAEALNEKTPTPPWWRHLPGSAAVLIHRFLRAIEFYLEESCRPISRTFRAIDEALLPTPNSGKGWSSRPALLFGATAAVLCFALVVGQFHPPTDWTQTTHRGILQSTSDSSQDLTLSRDAFVVRWEAAEGAFYDVRLLTQDDFDLIASVKGLREAQLAIPSSDLAALPDGTLLLCHVETRHESGEKTSSKFSIRLEESTGPPQKTD